MNCKDCFFHRATQSSGVNEKTLKVNEMLHYCHRYPRKVQVKLNHFCGEHLNHDGKKKVSQYVSDQAFMGEYKRKKREKEWISKKEDERYYNLIKGER